MYNKIDKLPDNENKLEFTDVLKSFIYQEKSIERVI